MKLIDLLLDVMPKELLKEDTTDVGDKIYLILDADRRIEIQFDETKVHEHYDAILLRLVHKANGELHRNFVEFRKLFDTMLDEFRDDKYICLNYTKTDCGWNGFPTEEDKLRIRDTISRYYYLWK